MRTKIRFFLLIVSIIYQTTSFAQGNNLPLLQDLYNEDSMIRFRTIISIMEDSLIDYIPYIEEELYKQVQPDMQIIYLDALCKLNSPNTIIIAHALIDSADNFLNRFPPIDPLESKVRITAILFDKGDTSTANFIIEYIDREGEDINLISIIPSALNFIVENIPSLKLIAKERLIFLAENCPSQHVRSFSLYYLNKNFESDVSSKLVQRFKEDNDFVVRLSTLGLLFKSNYDVLHNLLRERLFLDTSPTVRKVIADSLLFVYGSPADFNAVKDHFALETDPTIKSLLEWSLRDYEPFPSRNLNTIEDYIVYTNSLCDTLTAYTWLGDLTFSNELKNILTTAKTNLQNGDSLACRAQLKTFQVLVDNVYEDSLNSDPRFVTIEGWKFLYWNAQYILDRLPEPQANPNLLVNLKNSLGNQIPAGNVTYYESATSGWKDAVNNGDGTFTVITTKPAVSIRVFYEYANQTVHNVPAQNNTYTFQTVNTAVELRNSLGNLIDLGTVQYYADAWRTFGTTTNGVAYKELLPINYSFRMTYEYVPNDKQQDISTNSTVTFSTVLCAVKVTNANNQPLAGASTKYYSTAWRDIGLTNSEGVITKELLPKNLSFRATYGNVSLDKQQDIGVNSLVEIQLNVP